MYFVMIKRSLNTQFVSPAKNYFVYIHRTAPKVFDSRSEFFAFLCIVKAGSFVYIRVRHSLPRLNISFASISHRCIFFNIPQVDAHAPSHLRLQVTNRSLIILRREFTQPMNIISCRDHRFRGILSAKT